MIFAALLAAVAFTSCKNDDGDIWNSGYEQDDSDHEQEDRVAELEEHCKQMNTNISSLQKILEALQDDLSISEVEQISDGYIIHFSDGSTVTIKNGKDSGTTPVIGVREDTDGCYYWTLDGDWLTDEKGNKIKAEDSNGTDGVTLQLKIEDGRWMLSMDDGKTWTDIGQTTGADGTDGKDGTNGVFKSVTEDDDNVYFTLEDDSVITIPKSDNSKFAVIEVHVETKGEQENELAGYDYANIGSLKITGVLNDVDFLFICCMMPNLKDLDISEVNITELPTQAFYQSKNVENLMLPNTLVTILGKRHFI